MNLLTVKQRNTLLTYVLFSSLFFLTALLSGCNNETLPGTIDTDKDEYSSAQGDCDDTDAMIHPNAIEICGDGIDQDCDGSDLACDDSDADGDGYTVTNGDCNDSDATIYPGATEIGCDGIDQDCNGADLTTCTYYKDTDGDGYGDPNIFITTGIEVVSSSYVANNTDCDDSDSAVYPGATEACDGKDNNCSGEVDEGCASVTYYKDADGDTYVLFSDSVSQAPPAPAGYITDTHYGLEDCDDTDATIYPGATEIPNDGIDQNCNGYDSTSGCLSCHTKSGFTTTGHGKTSGTYASGNPAGNSDNKFASCTSYCHSESVSHNTANNPYRLTTAGNVTDFEDTSNPRSLTENTICLDCHATDGTNNAEATVHIGALSDTNKHYLSAHSSIGQTAGGNFCVDCHDPHGDANDYMIQDSVAKRSDGQYGTPATTVAVTFPDTSGTYNWAAYVNDTPNYDGLCQVCHETTARFKGISPYDYDSSHYSSSSGCTTCHSHSGGFMYSASGSACTACHTQAEFATTGHGKTSGTYASGNPAGNSDNKFASCISYCHIDTTGDISHFTAGTPATNPYRLTTAGAVTDFSDSGSATDNTICLDCHASDGTNNAEATVHIGALSDANKHYLTAHVAIGDTAGGNFCVDCHDPHGDSNDYMIQDSVAKRSDGQYGTPATTVAVTFPDTSGTYNWAAYVNNAPNYNGICQVCHETTDRFKGVSPYDYDASHYSSSRCTGCHSHSGGFEYGAGNGVCTICHTQAEFATTGHGKTSGTYASGNPAGNSDNKFASCISYCHIDTTGSVAHFTVGTPATNPYRLTTAGAVTDFSDSGSATDNTICLDCHATDGTNNAEATVHIGALSDANKHYLTAHVSIGVTAGGNFCVDCHDPHGDANDYMIQDSVAKRSDGQYGTPVTTVAVTFPDTSGTYNWAAYVNNAPNYNGICQVCHETTARFKGVTPYDYDSSHYSSSSGCTTCHSHSGGFMYSASGSACTTCHTQAEFATTGHGKASGTYASGNPAGNSDNKFASCISYCHIDTTGSVAHFTVGTPATNPYRLTTAGAVTDFSDAGSATDNTICLDCHATDGTNNAEATVHIGALADTNKHYLTAHVAIGDTAGGNFCVDCHDPHGDANDYMIHDSVTKVSDGQYGTPATTAVVTFSGTSGVYDWAAYVNDTPNYDGLCQVCHETTARFKGVTPYDYDASHGNNTRCTDCHNHSAGFESAGGAGTNCQGCHNTGGAASGVRDIESEFSKANQHGYAWGDANFDPLDCELCHYLTDHGTGTVKLKQWTDNTNYTPITYDATNLASVNDACLSCHNSGTSGDDLQFSNMGQINISDRWDDASTASYNKYAPGATGVMPNTVPVLTKAYSPHKNPATNQAKTDMDMSVSFSSSHPTNTVACLDCHPSHGSNLASGTNATMSTGGVMLKEDDGNGGTYTSEEELCWGCHADGMDYYGDNNDGNDSGAVADSYEWEGTWNKSIASYKAGSFISSHFYPSKDGGVTWSGGSPSGTRSNVYCSTCHEPHGVSSANDTNHAYRVPILRGTWLTSPYKEDRAPGSTSAATYNNASDPFGAFPRQVSDKYQADVASGAGYTSDSYASGYDGYFIDRNTFGASTYITETESQFAGLCANCHAKADLASVGSNSWTGHNTVKWDNTTGVLYSDIFKSAIGTRTGQGKDLSIGAGGSEWAMQWYGALSTDYVFYNSPAYRAYGSRIRSGDQSGGRTPSIDARYAYSGTSASGNNALNTWGLDYTAQTTGTYIQAGYHQFPCSKCHTPHASRLKRLLRTNCLDNGSATINANETGTGTDYDNSYANQSGGVTGNHTPAGGAIYSLIADPVGSTLGPNLMNYEAANCHSVGGSSSGGWNRISPW